MGVMTCQSTEEYGVPISSIRRDNVGVMTYQSAEEYAIAVRQLFPAGEYWDNQLNNHDSDLYHYCEAKGEELHHFAIHRATLFNESVFETACKTLDEWERIYTGKINRYLPIAERRNRIIAKQSRTTVLATIKGLVSVAGGTLHSIEPLYRPFCLAHSALGIQRMPSMHIFNTFKVSVTIPADEQGTFRYFNFRMAHSPLGVQRMTNIYVYRPADKRNTFETSVKEVLGVQNIIFFEYKEEK